jgi:hypothetical protein
MKNIHTVPLEVLSPKPDGGFFTEPHEAGWADEALAIVHVRETHGPAPRLALRAQISADGVRWFDHPAPPLLVSAPGGASLALTHFGNWLRLAGEVGGGPGGDAPTFLLDIYWVLKG